MAPADLPAPGRIRSIDRLRGLVMVLMALDHTRDFFSASGMNVRDVHTPALFLTRWITHFCAPVFVFLAGVSAFLALARIGGRRGLGRYLLVRGMLLIALEFTVVRFGWTFSLRPDLLVGQVIWAIGWGMVILAALISLPPGLVGLLGAAVIAGHNLLDPIQAADLGSLGWVWTLLHEPATLPLGPQLRFLALYSILPWAGVMAAGYGFGSVFRLEEGRRHRILLITGAALTLAFLLLRGFNGYGDPAAWTRQGGWLPIALSFLNCEKYPPSLLYLLMTLGPALALMPLLERIGGRPGAVLLSFGSVPLFFYLLHLPLIHGLAVLASIASGFSPEWLLGGLPFAAKPGGFGFSLPSVYFFWGCILLLLLPACRWYAGVKRRRRDSWLRFL
ncbi:MAG: heparan-alpha-glucosaminide N-acetyltransferase domain-containing protein [Synechococcaceae cyanobacterium]|nr:heparan-alpha-glucosaminide N-acetyltransferase domain-containing protein [Synechococcaceae cyanobacterium]